MRGESVAGRLARRALDTLALARSLLNRLRIKRMDLAEVLSRRAAASAGPSVKERQEDLVKFYECYENLVETLCDAAQYGPTPRLEVEYHRCRDWMQRHYPATKPFVIAYLRFDSEDAELILQAGGDGADAFEALIAPPDLHAFLKMDDGNTISRISRTRQALSLYGEHLRQLTSRGK